MLAMLSDEQTELSHRKVSMTPSSFWQEEAASHASMHKSFMFSSTYGGLPQKMGGSNKGH
eukprot:CAMPEP_0113924686 /NCGR_PEP_ID=MMETSP1159-20121227/2803_1 /TAXON_ID=88271 /ORGANISM="Picocystis salinarum" /LENGTH=59 /DNA_ID=CAMNT_0000924927 /DNA_START=201 /DNA_END=380 /DNA_ORIENTATION=+ /assembly_acc=CAM_ASM_000767